MKEDIKSSLPQDSILYKQNPREAVLKQTDKQKQSTHTQNQNETQEVSNM